MSLTVSSPVNAGGTVTVQMDLQDTISGLNLFDSAFYPVNTYVIALITNSQGNQNVSIQDWTHISGSIYRGQAQISPYAENGTWMVTTLYAGDRAGNSKTYYNSTDFDGRFVVSSPTPDTTPQVLQSITVVSQVVALWDTLKVRIELTDDVSGLAGLSPEGIGGGTQIQFTNSNNTQTDNISEWVRISGDIYEGKAVIADYGGNSTGTWKISYVYTTDNAGNAKYYYDGTEINAHFSVVQTHALSISPEALTFTSQESSKVFNIISNVVWTAQADQTWFTVSTLSGKDSGVASFQNLDPYRCMIA